MAAERGGAAARNRSERDGLDLGEPVRASIRVSVCTHNVRQFQPRRRDAATVPRGVTVHTVRPAEGAEVGQ